MIRYLIGVLAVLVVTGAIAALYFRGAAAVSADRQHAAEQRADQLGSSLEFSESARAKEHARAERSQAVAQQYEQDKNHAEATASQLAADLRAERVRLRPIWNCPARVPATAASAGQPDAGADDKAASIARILRAADDADAQIRALQALVGQDRAEH